MVREEPLTAQGLQQLYVAKAEAELADALAGDGDGYVAPRGAADARVLLVKGPPSRADVESGWSLAGPEGEASDKAFRALGYPIDTLLRVCSRPTRGTGLPSQGATSGRWWVERLQALIEAVDPDIVVTLDEEAAADVCEAMDVQRGEPGRVAAVEGRRVLLLEPFDEALADEDAKRRVWGQLKQLQKEEPE